MGQGILGLGSRDEFGVGVGFERCRAELKRNK